MVMILEEKSKLLAPPPPKKNSIKTSFRHKTFLDPTLFLQNLFGPVNCWTKMWRTKHFWTILYKNVFQSFFAHFFLYPKYPRPNSFYLKFFVGPKKNLWTNKQIFYQNFLLTTFLYLNFTQVCLALSSHLENLPSM